MFRYHYDGDGIEEKADFIIKGDFMEKGNRLPWINGIRCIAILLVILTHATENTYELNNALLHE